MPAKEIPSILSVNHKVATREAGPYKNLGELDQLQRKTSGYANKNARGGQRGSYNSGAQRGYNNQDNRGYGRGQRTDREGMGTM